MSDLEGVNLFTTTYHPQCNGQTKRSNRAILQALRHYIADHPKDWNLYSDILDYAYNTQVHRATKCAPFELVLFRAQQPLAVAPRPTERPSASATHQLLRWRQWLKCLLDRICPGMRKAQEKYRCDFNKRGRVPAKHIRSG